MSNEAPEESPSVTFETEVASFGNNTGIVVSSELIAELGAGQRAPVDVEVNDHRYRTTVGVVKGRYLVSVSAAVRRQNRAGRRRPGQSDTHGEPGAADGRTTRRLRGSTPRCARS